jgi:hypothetical protein
MAAMNRVSDRVTRVGVATNETNCRKEQQESHQDERLDRDRAVGVHGTAAVILVRADRRHDIHAHLANSIPWRVQGMLRSG